MSAVSWTHTDAEGRTIVRDDGAVESAPRAVPDGRGGYLCPECGYGPFRTPESALENCPNKGGRNHS